MRRSEIRSREIFNAVYRVMQRVKLEFPKEVKEYVAVEDFAPEELRVGKEIVDPVTGLRGEVIGYYEEPIFFRSTAERGS